MGETDRQNIYSDFLDDRKIFLRGEVEVYKTTDIIAQLLYLEKLDPKKKITLYLNSIGGVVPQGLAIYDTIQLIKPPVEIIAIGEAQSMASAILCGGEKGCRYATPNSTIMLHSPKYGIHGEEPYIDIYATQLKRYREKLEEIISKHSGQPLEKVKADFEKTKFFTPKEALEYGIIDLITESL